MKAQTAMKNPQLQMKMKFVSWLEVAKNRCIQLLSLMVSTHPLMCVDTLSGSVDTLQLKFQLMIFLDTWPLGDQGNLPRFLCPRTLRLLMDIWGYKYPCFWYSKGSHVRKSQEHSGRRQEEREKGICIQRSKVVPPREREGEEEKELVIAVVLVQKEIQPITYPIPNKKKVTRGRRKNWRAKSLFCALEKKGLVEKEGGEVACASSSSSSSLQVANIALAFLKIRGFGASSGHLQRLGDSWSIREGFPDFSLVSTSVKNPEEGVIGSFLGLPKESFTATFDPFGVFFRGKYPTHNVPTGTWRQCLDAKIQVRVQRSGRPLLERPETAAKSSEQNSKLFCPSI
ncbi:hypothetical protein Taro_024124 [Colocasia esculenta]|uniref:Uncharacterized protein n=1 Tax=Colocasia esculenta TaxID=4460 RepID=A0A843VCU0_COLES|nr:hypothetical protein [Colocasia esculenta]